jgi:hypothetical protein
VDKVVSPAPLTEKRRAKKAEEWALAGAAMQPFVLPSSAARDHRVRAALRYIPMKSV